MKPLLQPYSINAVCEETLAIYEDDFREKGIAAAPRQGWVRTSPHFYISPGDIDRLLAELPHSNFGPVSPIRSTFGHDGLPRPELQSFDRAHGYTQICGHRTGSAIGEFGATILFAGNLEGVTQTMPLAIYLGLERSLNIALALSTLLVIVSFLLLLATRRLESRRDGSIN